MLKKLIICCLLLTAVTVSFAQAQTLTEARIPVRVNVAATVSILPPDAAAGTDVSDVALSANTWDTLRIMINANTSILHRTKMSNAAPITARYNRGNVSVELSPQHYGDAALSIHSINGRRVLSDKISASNRKASGNTFNISRPNIAAGVYLLSIKGVDGNSYSTRFAHSGGRMNINTIFSGGSDHILRKDAASTSAGMWTLTATAAGHTSYSQTFTPVPDINQAWDITLVSQMPVVGSSDKGDGTYTNPVIWADVPDMSFIRVGNVYWMASTTMHMTPGVPIMKSYDLVNWETVGYVYNVLDDDNKMKLQTGNNMYAGGTWASSLVYKENTQTFILVVPSPTTNRTYIFHTKDPEKEAWQKYTLGSRYHDCSLLLDDDGKNYLFYGGGSMIQLNSDVTGLADKASSQKVIQNLHAPDPNDGYVTPAGEGLAEGLQVQKIGNTYYAFAICSGNRGWFRHQVVHRSQSLNGPWEGKVVAYDQGVAQGTIVYIGGGDKHTDRSNGSWQAMIFRDSGPVGRAPWLMPVTWVDGWPMHGKDGSHAPLPTSAAIPITVNTGIKSTFASDEFNNDHPKPVYYGTSVSTQTNMYDYNNSNLHLAWQWNHNPDNRYWSLTARPGWLRLTTGHISDHILAAPNTLTQRTFGEQSSAVTYIDVANMKDGDEAGLTLFTAKYGSIGVKMEDGNKYIVTTLANSWTEGHATNKGAESGQRVQLNGNRVYLKVTANYENDRGNFYYSSDGNTWTKLGSELRMSYSTNNHFMGYRFGLYNFAKTSTGGYVDFDYYRVSDQL